MTGSRLVLSMLCAVAFTTIAPILRAGTPAGAGSAAASSSPSPQQNGRASGVFLLEEELIYEVTYMRIPLGSIRIVTTHQEGQGENARFTSAAYVRSYSGVPFVHIQETDESTMNTAALPFSFQARELTDEKWKITDYAFDQQAHRLIEKESYADSESGTNSVLKKADTVAIRPNCVDGLSLLFFARVNARSNGGRTEVPTFLKGKEGTTVINLERKVTSEDIGPVDYSVDVVELDGDAQVSGILGMSGEFTGWFSNDSASVPIKGKVKIFLGSITIELKKWKRSDGWTPPRAPQ